MLWESTFDAVVDVYKQELDMSRQMMKGSSLPMIPCCICCIICYQKAAFGEAMAAAERQRQSWLTLVQQEQLKYADHGFHVTLAKEVRGVNETANLVNVGLKFDITSAPVAAEAIQPAVLSTPEEMDRRTDTNVDDIASQLEKLAELHSKGVLSDDEFTAAKAKLIN